jgi:hypothetical protein
MPHYIVYLRSHRTRVLRADTSQAAAYSLVFAFFSLTAVQVDIVQAGMSRANHMDFVIESHESSVSLGRWHVDSKLFDDQVIDAFYPHDGTLTRARVSRVGACVYVLRWQRIILMAVDRSAVISSFH